MIMDAKQEFCDEVAVNAAAGTALVGNVMDFGSFPPTFKGKDKLSLVITVSAAFTSGGSATVAFQLVSDAAAAIATNGTASVHAQIGPVAYTTLTAGKILVIPVGGTFTYERYLGLLVVTATATTTAGTINAFLTDTPEDYVAHADAVSF